MRDCKLHYTDHKIDDEQKLSTSIFITEGDSASGSITKSRNVQNQAVFSLRGKPLNSFGLTKKIVYENEEFNLLQHALNIEDGLDNLRYNQIIIAKIKKNGPECLFSNYFNIFRNNNFFVFLPKKFTLSSKL